MNPRPEPIHESPQDPLDAETRRPDSSQLQSPQQSKVQTFSGETSIAHTLNQMEDRLEQLGVTYQEYSSAPPSQPLTPPPNNTIGNGKERTKSSYIQQVLLSHGVAIDRAKWDHFLEAFCDEVHALYPFLHLPAIRSFYNQMWDDWFLCPANGQSEWREHRIQAAQVLLCLATGRCTGSSRSIGTEEARHSAGWSLYSAASEILGDLFEVLREGASPLQALQTLLLMVVHLFRLDANERAEKILALAISHAHNLGIHRQKVLNKLPAFEDEMFRRLWWCIYVWDRRLALDTGRPFLIQDVNVDTAIPRNLGDNWLSEHSMSTLTSAELDEEVQVEISGERITSIPFLTVMIHYSRVVAKVWEALYGAFETELISGPFLNEYLENLLSKFQKEVSPDFVHDLSQPFETQFADLTWWQIKQKIVIHMRLTILRLLIRKPMLNRLRVSSTSGYDDFENESICIQLAQSIIAQFNHIPETYPKYMFPFINYLTSATMTSLGLIIKEPLFRQRYGPSTIAAARSLKTYCRKTWTSGKMVRTVSKLNHMVSRVLGDGPVGIRYSIGGAAPLPSPSKNPLECSLNNKGLQQNGIGSLDADFNTPRDNTEPSSSSNTFLHEPSISLWDNSPSIQPVPCTSDRIVLPSSASSLLSQARPLAHMTSASPATLSSNNKGTIISSSLPKTNATGATLHVSEAADRFYAPGPPPASQQQQQQEGPSTTSSTSPPSDFPDLVMTDFDFEEVIYPGSMGHQAGNGSAQSSSFLLDRYEEPSSLVYDASTRAPRAGNEDGGRQFPRSEQDVQSKGTLDMEWMQILLGAGLHSRCAAN